MIWIGRIPLWWNEELPIVNHLKEAYLGYTYSGLDHMYGYAGYKICVYYNMAFKRLTL